MYLNSSFKCNALFPLQKRSALYFCKLILNQKGSCWYNWFYFEKSSDFRGYFKALKGLPYPLSHADSPQHGGP